MSLSQPIRTLLLGVVLITATLLVRRYFEPRPAANVVEDEFTPPPIRIARDRQPTIVESEENWLDTAPRDATGESSNPLGTPLVLDLPPSPGPTARPDTRRGIITR